MHRCSSEIVNTSLSCRTFLTCLFRDSFADDPLESDGDETRVWGGESELHFFIMEQMSVQLLYSSSDKFPVTLWDVHEACEGLFTVYWLGEELWGTLFIRCWSITILCKKNKKRKKEKILNCCWVEEAWRRRSLQCEDGHALNYATHQNFSIWLWIIVQTKLLSPNAAINQHQTSWCGTHWPSRNDLYSYILHHEQVQDSASTLVWWRFSWRQTGTWTRGVFVWVRPSFNA